MLFNKKAIYFLIMKGRLHLTEYFYEKDLENLQIKRNTVSANVTTFNSPLFPVKESAGINASSEQKRTPMKRSKISTSMLSKQNSSLPTLNKCNSTQCSNVRTNDIITHRKLYFDMQDCDLDNFYLDDKSNPTKNSKTENQERRLYAISEMGSKRNKNSRYYINLNNSEIPINTFFINNKDTNKPVTKFSSSSLHNHIIYHKGNYLDSEIRDRYNSGNSSSTKNTDNIKFSSKTLIHNKQRDDSLSISKSKSQNNNVSERNEFFYENNNENEFNSHEIIGKKNNYVCKNKNIPYILPFNNHISFLPFKNAYKATIINDQILRKKSFFEISEEERSRKQERVFSSSIFESSSFNDNPIENEPTLKEEFQKKMKEYQEYRNKKVLYNTEDLVEYFQKDSPSSNEQQDTLNNLEFEPEKQNNNILPCKENEDSDKKFEGMNLKDFIDDDSDESMGSQKSYDSGYDDDKESCEETNDKKVTNNMDKSDNHEVDKDHFSSTKVDIIEEEDSDVDYESDSSDFQGISETEENFSENSQNIFDQNNSIGKQKKTIKVSLSFMIPISLEKGYKNEFKSQITNTSKTSNDNNIFPSGCTYLSNSSTVVKNHYIYFIEFSITKTAFFIPTIKDVIEEGLRQIKSILLRNQKGYLIKQCPTMFSLRNYLKSGFPNYEMPSKLIIIF